MATGPRYQRSLVLLLSAAAVGVLSVCGLMLWPRAQEGYWIWVLDHGTWDEREAAADALVSLGSPHAFSVLVDRVWHEFPGETREAPYRLESLEAIRRILLRRPRESRAVLGDLLMSFERDTRLFACVTIALIGPELKCLAPQLRLAIEKETDDDVRTFAQEALSIVGGE